MKEDDGAEAVESADDEQAPSPRVPAMAMAWRAVVVRDMVILPEIRQWRGTLCFPGAL